MENFDYYLDRAVEFLPTLIAALLLLIIGWRIISWLGNVLQKFLQNKEMDDAIRPFLTSLFKILLKILLIFSAAEMVGFKTASFVAILAAAGFAVGMALQGSLGNFAAGVMILFFKPYRIDDIIEVAGAKGKVTSIQIFNTILVTPKNETVIIPNSTAIGDKIINYSTVGNTRVDLYTHMPYQEDFSKVHQIIMELVNKHPLILKDPAASVDIESYESHNLQIGVFVFCKPEDYWTVFYDLNNSIKPALGKNNIQVAYSEGIELGGIGKE